MATKTTGSIFNDSDAKTSWGAWTKYFSFPISTINNALNNTSNVPQNAKINSVKINVTARFEVSGSARVYLKFGIGGNGSISKELLGENQIGSTAFSGSETQSATLPLSSTEPSYAVSTANGSYFTICIYTSNNLPKTFWVDSVTLTIDYTEHTHSYTSKVTTAATCTSAGVKTYTCSCGHSYTESIAALGHSYGSPTYTWSSDGKSCTAKRVCSNNSSHTESATATITSAVKTAATCTTKGTTRYTAKFSVSWASTQTKDVQDIAAKGHTWVNATCTAPKTCSVCGATEGSARGHLYTIDVTKPTETSIGYTTHRCIYCDDSYTDTYTCLITFKNGNGSVLQTGEVALGDTPVCSKTPTKASTAEYTYTWDTSNPWTPVIVPATQSQTYEPNFTATKRKYKITIVWRDESVVFNNGSTEGEYGKNTYLPVMDIEGYRFVKWSDGNTDYPIRTVLITGEATYTAIYEKIAIPIKVNGKQVTGCYIVPSTKTVIFDVGTTPTVDAIPENSYPLKKIHINGNRTY